MVDTSSEGNDTNHDIHHNQEISFIESKCKIEVESVVPALSTMGPKVSKVRIPKAATSPPASAPSSMPLAKAA